MKNKNIIFYLVIIILTLILIVMGYMIKNKEKFKNKDTDENIVEQIIEIEENTDNSDNELNDEDIQVQTNDNENVDQTNNEQINQNEEVITEHQEEPVIEQGTYDFIEVPTQEMVGSEGLKLNPSLGDMYANLIIGKIGVNAPVFFGANDEIILKGVGHDSDSYFPGEGGAIIMCEHNYMNNFNRLQELENGDAIQIKTGYGDFNYVVVDKQIVHDTETYKLPITKEKEQLMIYTCHEMPEEVGQTQYRMVVYADRV